MSTLIIETHTVSLERSVPRWPGSDGWIRVAHINCSLLPIYLVLGPPIKVKESLESLNGLLSSDFGQLESSHGVLYRSGNFHVALYLHKTALYCIILDFSILDSLSSTKSELPLVPHLTTNLAPRTPRDDVFEKVLEKRKQHGPQLLPNPYFPSNSRPTMLRSGLSVSSTTLTPLSLQILTTNEQITLAVSRMALSGLRIRGLSSHLNANAPVSSERLAVREIYQMTTKLAIFALRKFGYSFNAVHTSEKRRPVTLDDIQEIVEKLLVVFIDMER